MTRLIAENDLYNPGEYGRVRTGQQFTCRDDTAAKLIKQGSARRVIYETKVIYPEAPEVSARDPFHYLPVSHQESPHVAAESDRVLPESDLPEPRAADRGKRAGRKASDSE